MEMEEIFSLTEAAKYVQRTFGGRKPCLGTMARWCIKGLRGIRLESVKRGGERVTSKEAINRFFKRIAEPTVRQVNNDAVRRAEEYLIAEGVY
jgi:hypothetical protein